MDKLRKSFRSSFRKKSHQEDIDNRTVTWPKDEAAVKTNTSSFDVKYLGSVEVFESRGMQVCEEALKLLKNSKRRYIRGTLHVSGDGLRVVDKDTKGLVLDQTIEKVSFCAPDRSYEKGFSYICRDGTTRRWMCHGFLAVGDTGERLSHAVGCAFAICLEKKQMREKESVQYHYNKKDNVFTRFGSFQQGSIHDRLKDPQEFKQGIEPPKPAEPVDNPNAVPRPRPSDMYLRQASMRGGKIPGAANSLFKRQYSLRLDELPSTLSRQKSVYNNVTETSSGKTCTTIQEDSLSPTKDFSSLPPIATNMITSTPMVKGAMVDPTPAPASLQMAPLTAPPVLDGDNRIGPFQLPISGSSIVNRNTTESNLLCSSSGPVSLPVNLSGSIVTPISVLTDDIPMELPPPILSPTLGCNTNLETQQKSDISTTTKNVWSKPSTSSQSDILPVFDTFNLGVNKSTELNATNNNEQTKSFNPFISPGPFTSLPIEINRVGSTNSNGTGGPLPPLPQRSSNPPPLPNRIGNPSTSSCMSPSSGGGEGVILRQSQSLAPAALSSGGSQGSGLVMEGFNPWDNVPDQPIIRTSGGMTVKSGRPVSMIEQESMSKAAGQPPPTMERGYSLEASIDTTNHYNDDLSYNNLFTMPGESDSSSGLLRDPFDSDWADRALKTGSCDDWTVKSGNHADITCSNPDWTVQSGSNSDWTNQGKSLANKQFQDKNDNSFKSFELHL